MYRFFAMTSQGLESALVQEMESLGLKNIKKTYLGAYFDGEMVDCYAANVALRTATRVLLTLESFKAQTPEDLYKFIYQIPFEKFINANSTLVVHATSRGNYFKDQRYVALKAKDAIADRFREQFGERPSVDKDNPDLVVNIKVVDDQIDVSLDTSGDSLSMHGYRDVTVMAPLREHLGAGLLRHAGWHGQMNLVDPMCGSGTFLIEGAMQALNYFPALNRKRFQFQKFNFFKAQEWKEVSEKFLSQEKTETDIQFFGYDIDPHAVKAAKTNVHAAGVSDFVKISRMGIDLLSPPCETGMLIVNPPYGERLSNDENLKDVYRDMGFALKNRFKGWTCWVLSGHPDLVQLMGLKSSLRIPVWNGPIECRLLKYEIKA